MSETFQEWMGSWIRSLPPGRTRLALSDALAEFDRRFRVGSMDDPINPSAIVWFEVVEEQGDE